MRPCSASTSSRGAGGWWFAGASPLPDLRAGGDALSGGCWTCSRPARSRCRHDRAAVGGAQRAADGHGGPAGWRISAPTSSSSGPAGSGSRRRSRSAPIWPATIRAAAATVELARITGAYLRPVEPELVPELTGPGRAGPRPPDAGGTHRVHRSRAGDQRLPRRQPAVGDGVQRIQALPGPGHRPARILRAGHAGLHRPRRRCSTSRPGTSRLSTSRAAASVPSSRPSTRWPTGPGSSGCAGARCSSRSASAGPDVRVHVVGDQTFAAIVDSQAVDYRYARAQVGTDARLRAFRLDDDLARALRGPGRGPWTCRSRGSTSS